MAALAIEGGGRYQFVKHLGTGNFGVCQLMRDLQDGEHVAVKFIPRGSKIDKNVRREIMVHSRLRHPLIVGFKRVFLTPSHLGIVLQYCEGGELFDRVRQAGHFTEDEARYFFQQLICGVDYCHQQQVAHRDLKLENTLLDGSPAPLLKIADFGYCKSAAEDTPPKSTVGTPAYLAPEIVACHPHYDGKMADVWSCGVHLYVMLVGAYPFDDPRAPGNMNVIMTNITRARYAWPRSLTLSAECKDLVKKMLEPDAANRISITDVKQHPWFLTNLPDELQENCNGLPCYALCPQPAEEIKQILHAAKRAGHH